MPRSIVTGLSSPETRETVPCETNGLHSEGTFHGSTTYSSFPGLGFVTIALDVFFLSRAGDSALTCPFHLQ